MVVADQHALARIFASHDVARDGLCHNARVGERELFGNHVSPAVGSKFNRSHRRQRKYTRSDISAIQPLWTVFESLQKFFTPLLFQPFHDFAYVLGAIAWDDEQGVWRFNDN